MNSNRLKLTVGAAAVAAALTGAYSLGHATMSGAPAPAAVSQAPAATAALPDMSSIVARNSPSVVNISVSGTRKGGPNASRNPQLDEDESIQEFFRRFRIPQNRGDMPVRGLSPPSSCRASSSRARRTRSVKNPTAVTAATATTSAARSRRNSPERNSRESSRQARPLTGVRPSAP